MMDNLEEMLEKLYEQGWNDKLYKEYDPSGSEVWKKLFAHVNAIHKDKDLLIETLENVGEQGDGEYRYCCGSSYGSSHKDWCELNNVVSNMRRENE